jgi:integrase
VDAGDVDVAQRLGPRAQAWLDLPDIAEIMLGTGGRIGEVLACDGSDVDPATRNISLAHHLVRIERQGMVRTKGRKGKQRGLTLQYPSWCDITLRRRKHAAGDDGPLFPAWNGQWLDPSNVTKRFRTACDAIGYEWMASRLLRHTVGTHIVDSGQTVAAAADQLGNTPEVVEKHYRRKKVANGKVADALESLMDTEETRTTGHKQDTNNS